MKRSFWSPHVRWTINMKYKLVEVIHILTCCDAQGVAMQNRGLCSADNNKPVSL